MLLSQKCQYSLRALFELAKHYGNGAVKIADIAQAQAIPPRFLEIILGQLKQRGFVNSVRGRNGGYTLVKLPRDISVGEIIRFCDGPIAPVDCTTGGKICQLHGECAFLPMWKRAQKALSDVYDNTSLADLINEDQKNLQILAYCI